jgi:hypothetical protein
MAVMKFCKRLLLQKDYSSLDDTVPFAVADSLSSSAEKLSELANKLNHDCDLSILITSAIVAGVKSFHDSIRSGWHFSSAAVHDLKARLHNFVTRFGGNPLELDEPLNAIIQQAQVGQFL